MSVVGIKDLKTLLGDDEKLFDFKIITVDNKQFIHMKAKMFLGKDTFKRIFSFVRENGGQYISAGKASCFRFPRPTETPHIPQLEAPSQPTQKQEQVSSISELSRRLREAEALIHGVLDELKFHEKTEQGDR